MSTPHTRHLSASLLRSNNLLYKDIVATYTRVTNSYNRTKRHVQQGLKSQVMASDQTVPDISPISTYDEVAQELIQIHNELVHVYAILDRLLLQSKEAQVKVRRMNRVETIIHQYNTPR